MNAVDRDDVIHAVSQVMAFYGKELDDLQGKLWVRALSKFDVGQIKRALADYTAVGKYAPKPVDIIQVLTATTEQTARALPPPERSVVEAPPEVAKAWAYVIKLWDMGDFGNAGNERLDPSEIDRRLTLCNRQACASRNPESIPPDAWLSEVWGCGRDEAVRRAGQ